MTRASLKRLPDWPTDRQLARAWDAAGWVDIGEAERQCWLPTALSVIADDPLGSLRDDPLGGLRVGIVALPRTDNKKWAIALDGTTCREKDGEPMVWDDLHVAGLDALRMVEGDWHGPSLRFRPRDSWRVQPGSLTMRLTLSGDVAVVRPFQFPFRYDAGWGVFIDRRRQQSRCLQTIGMVKQFPTADAARHAADTEVGHWLRSGEVRLPSYSRSA